MTGSARAQSFSASVSFLLCRGGCCLLPCRSPEMFEAVKLSPNVDVRQKLWPRVIGSDTHAGAGNAHDEEFRRMCGAELIDIRCRIFLGRYMATRFCGHFTSGMAMFRALRSAIMADWLTSRSGSYAGRTLKVEIAWRSSYGQVRKRDLIVPQM